MDDHPELPKGDDNKVGMEVNWDDLTFEEAFCFFGGLEPDEFPPYRKDPLDFEAWWQ